MSGKIKDTFLETLTKNEDKIFHLVVTTNSKDEEKMKSTLIDTGVKIRYSFVEDSIIFTMEATGKQALKLLSLEFISYMREMMVAHVC